MILPLIATEQLVVLNLEEEILSRPPDRRKPALKRSVTLGTYEGWRNCLKSQQWRLKLDIRRKKSDYRVVKDSNQPTF